MIKLLAPAKINLFLNVLAKREDNYHELETIFQKIELYDTIILEEKEEGIEVECSYVNEVDNLSYKAAHLLTQVFEVKKGVKIKIEKHIPIAAGLGGGSSDAAATLMGLNKLWHLSLSQNDLLPLASKLGADVPFFIFNQGLALGTGIGSIITPLPPLPQFWLILICPKIKVSSAKIYQDLKFMLTNENIRSKMIINAIKQGDLEKISQLLYNTLEKVVFPQYPEIKRLKDELLKQEVLGALMSGSGSSVFGMVKTELEAINIYNKLKGGDELIFVTKIKR